MPWLNCFVPAFFVLIGLVLSAISITSRGEKGANCRADRLCVSVLWFNVLPPFLLMAEEGRYL